MGLVVLSLAGCVAQPRADRPLVSPAQISVDTKAVSNSETGIVPRTEADLAAAIGAHPIRMTVAGDCPSLVGAGPAVDDWIDNPDSSGLSALMVPDAPTAARVCRYEGAPIVANPTLGVDIAGALHSSATLGHADATHLADLLNVLPHPALASNGSCVARAGHSITAIAFSVPGRPDVDVWFDDQRSSCDAPWNGVRRAGGSSESMSKFETFLSTVAAPSAIVCIDPAGPC